MEASQTANCSCCGLSSEHEALDRHRRCVFCHGKRDEALENLAETAAAYCERLPIQVQEALHRIPFIEKVHVDADAEA